MLGDRQPTTTVGHFVRSAVTTAQLVAAGQLSQPTTHLARPLRFADGTMSYVFRETAADGVATADPAVLVVRFSLRMVGTSPWLHAAFRRECVLHTPLFAGFPGFRSKLWLTDLQTGVYRGLYEWNRADLASDYAETLAQLLRVVSVQRSVSHHVVAGVRRDALLRDPTLVTDGPAWSRLIPPEPTQAQSA
ncbi:MAG TPA: hypothetical protein VK923_15060 [Euzebyales bacterium]|nr:hypothetical protein [Euzebyales bacterium]